MTHISNFTRIRQQLLASAECEITIQAAGLALANLGQVLAGRQPYAEASQIHPGRWAMWRQKALQSAAAMDVSARSIAEAHAANELYDAISSQPPAVITDVERLEDLVGRFTRRVIVHYITTLADEGIQQILRERHYRETYTCTTDG